MPTKQVTLDDIGNVTLYKRRGNRSLRLSVTARGEVRVSMPSWLPYKAGEQFARSKADWILAHQPQTKQTGLQHGQRVGKAHRLHFTADYSAAKVTTRLVQGEIRVIHPLSIDIGHQSVQDSARRASVRALRKEAEQLLPQRLQTLSEKTGLDYRTVSVKPLKTRWGSCSSTKEIILNIFLVQLPWHLIDYVLVHELTHTKVMRHGPPFWEEMERHVPLARRLRKEINQHQPTI